MKHPSREPAAPQSAADRAFTVVDDEQNLRLDAFLVARCPDRSRTRIQADLKEGRVLVNARSRSKSFRLTPGDEVTYTPSEQRELSAEPQDIPLDIVYEDASILVVNKPVDLVVHPAPGSPDGTLVNALLHYCRHLADSGDSLRPGIVHRLDKDTSGLLAVALDDVAHRSLSRQLADHSMGRTYHVINWGSWKEEEGKLDGSIGRDPGQRNRMAVVTTGGKRAVTRYRVLEDFGFVQHCEVRLETGRTHQIRVHFAHRGHPVLGDRLYGNDQRARGVHPLDRSLADRVVRLAHRQLLHAARLELEHPVTGKKMTFEAPLPSDLESVLAILRAG